MLLFFLPAQSAPIRREILLSEGTGILLFVKKNALVCYFFRLSVLCCAILCFPGVIRNKCQVCMIRTVHPESPKYYTQLSSAQLSAAGRAVAVPCHAVLCRAVFSLCPCQTKRASVYVHTVYACGVWAVFLEHGALALCKSPVYTYRIYIRLGNLVASYTSL